MSYAYSALGYVTAQRGYWASLFGIHVVAQTRHGVQVWGMYVASADAAGNALSIHAHSRSGQPLQQLFSSFAKLCIAVGTNGIGPSHSSPGMHLGMGVAAGAAASLGAPAMHQVLPAALSVAVIALG